MKRVMGGGGHKRFAVVLTRERKVLSIVKGAQKVSIL